jgi:large subunit ribosomal protein L10
LKRTEKEAVVEKLVAKMLETEAAFVTDFKGLKVDEIGGLRRKIGEAGGEFQVAKNTLIKRAVSGTSNEPLSELLSGNNALSTTRNDPAALAKVLVEFAKSNEKFVVKGGVLTGKKVGFEQIKVMAELPSREVLLAQMLGAMNSIPAGFVRVLAAVPQSLVYVLASIRDQKENPTG